MEGSETIPSIHETEYLRLKAAIIARDLAEVYTHTPEEMTLAASLTGSETAEGRNLVMESCVGTGRARLAELAAELVINLKTAQALDLTIPPMLHFQVAR